MKKVFVFWALFIFSANYFSANGGATSYDSTAFVRWSTAANDSGQLAVAYVKKTDTIGGDTTPPVLYQFYKGSQLLKSDTILSGWNKNNVMIGINGGANFALALDNSGWAHFVVNGDSGSLLYFSNRTDGVWKQKQMLNKAKSSKPFGFGSFGNAYFGRSNAVAISANRIDIVTSVDYYVYGYWPFSVMFRLFGEVAADSLANEYVTTDTGMYAEEIYDLSISNRFNRLIITYALGENGGWNSGRIIVSKTYPTISKYYFRKLTSGWAALVSPIKIASEDVSRVTITINGYPYPLAIGDSGISLSSVRIPYRAITAKSFAQKDGEIFNLRGQSLSGSIAAAGVSGVYLRKFPAVSRTFKHLQVGR